MLEKKFFVTSFLLFLFYFANQCKATDGDTNDKNQVSQRETSLVGLCDIHVLETLQISQAVKCDKAVVYGQMVENRAKCIVKRNDKNVDEYICDSGLWRLTSGADSHSLQKRDFWSDSRDRFKKFVKMVYHCDIKGDDDHKVCVQEEVESLSPPSYTYCPPSGQVYTAGSTKRTAVVTWSEPEATDDKEVSSNEQVCCEYGNGDEFPGLPEDGRKHTISYIAKDGHGLSDSCTFSVIVKYITCDPQDWPNNGQKISCSHGNIYGSECTFACNAGYEMVTSSKSTCGNDGTWDNSPVCQKVLCPAPFAITNGQITCGDSTFPFDDDCLFQCNDGFKLTGPPKMTCQTDQTWSVEASQVSCVDDEAPVISCQTPQVFYADQGSFGSSVTWLTPEATDNVDLDPAIIQTSGPTQGDVLLEGYHYVTYKATDVTGNSVPALSECTITLEITVIKCSMGPTDVLGNSQFMTYSCSDTSFYNGVSCSLDCLLNLPLNGTDLIRCEQDGTTDKGIWNWGSGQEPFCEVVECPFVTAPENGAYTMDSVNARPVRIMSCQTGYDIPSVESSFIGRLSCQDSGAWYPLDAFPDCVVSFLPILRLPAELYYDGDCNDAATQDQIKQQILKVLSDIKADVDNSICPDPNTCTVDNLIVVCGETSGRRRKDVTSGQHQDKFTSGHAVEKRQTSYGLATFDINVEFNVGNQSLNDAYLGFLDILTQISDRIQGDVNTGKFDVQGFTLQNDSYQADFSAIGFVCDSGSKLDTAVLKCKPCTKGTYMSSTSGYCELCEIGSYMDHEGATQCEPCPTGYSTLSTGAKNVQTCIKLCSPGFYSTSTMEPCSACPVGQYQPLQGQSGCVSCPNGMATNATNSVSANACTPFDLSLRQTTTVGAFTANGGKVISVSLWLKIGQGQSSDIAIIISDAADDILTLNCSPNISLSTSSGATFQTEKSLTSDHWTHIVTSLDFGTDIVKSFVDDELVIEASGELVDPSRTLTSGTVSIVSHSNGVFVSGLVLHNRHFSSAEMTSLSSTCSHSAGDEMFTMSTFLQNTVEGVAVIAPTTCDPVDECIGKPCGSHTCINKVGEFQCICNHGMTGDLCDIPPDYCQGHNCQNGDCIPGNGTYSCSCTNGYSGAFCDRPPVDGGFSEWSEWSGCDVTCGGGSRVRSRNCSEPVPDDFGMDCIGERIQTESCNDQICRSCPELKRSFGTVKTCSENADDNVLECNLTCFRGQVLPNGQRPFEKYWCGDSTNYTWFPIDKTPECIEPNRPDRLGALLTVNYDSSISSAHEDNLVSTIDSNMSDVGCVKSGKCTSVTSLESGSRKRRSTSSTLSVEFTVQLTDTGDLNLADYLEFGTESSAMTELLSAISALNEALVYIQNNTESIFNVIIGGVAYTIDDSLTSYGSTVTCEAGYAGADGFCGLCAPGTKLVYPNCENCEVGTYQPDYGQSSCLYCPAGYTTPTYGATDVSECSVETNITRAPTTTTTTMTTTDRNRNDHETGTEDGDNKSSNITLIVIATLSGTAFLCSCITIGVLVWRNCVRRKVRQNQRSGSLASIGMVAPVVTNTKHQRNGRTTFTTPSGDSVGASSIDKPPAYESHNFFQAPPVYNRNPKVCEKSQVLGIVDI